MKLSSKLFPLTIVTSAISVIAPVSLTSCGNVYVDLIKKGYQTKFDPLPKQENITNQKATELYYNALCNPNIGPELIKDDMLWSASGLLEYSGDNLMDIDGDRGTLSYTKYLINIGNFEFKPGTYEQDGYFLLSYKISGELEMHMDNIKQATSYKVTGTQFTWNMENIPFSVEFHSAGLTNDYHYRGWMLVPKEYHPSGEQGGFWDALNGDEHIDFSYRSICKGYSQNGIQNYGYEEIEQAIIDKDHKYVPRLEEPLTNFFLYDSGYLYNLVSELEK